MDRPVPVSALEFIFEYEQGSTEEWIEVTLDKEVVARAKVRRATDRIVVKFLTVHEKYERRGIGRSLVDHLRQEVSEILAKGVKYQARGFWIKLGFEPCDNPRYYRWSRPTKEKTQTP